MVRIEIWVDSTDPPTGRVGDHGEPVLFCGWIDLLAVLSNIVDTTGDEHSDLGARTQPELGEDV